MGEHREGPGFPDRLTIASRNPGKIREIRSICRDWPVTWVEAEPPEIDETGGTYRENALLKAHGAAGAAGVPALADDSGIEVDALGGRPGPRSARFAGPDADDERNLRELLRALAGVPAGGRTARYRAVAAVAWPTGEEVWAEGVCEGVIRSAPTGSGGFGYDPVFEPAGWDRTMAELAPEEKDRISHRAGALRALRDALAVAPNANGY